MSTLKVDTLQNSVGENLVFGSKNLLINGQMAIFQRATSVTGITSESYNTADRWKTGISGLGTWTQTRSTDVPSAQGFGYSLKMDCTTADASPAAGDYLQIQQRLEGQDLTRLLKGTSSTKKVTLSFWVKSNKTGTYICELYDNDNSRAISKSYTISSSSTWEKKEITFDGDTSGVFDNDNALSLFVNFYLGAGSNYTSGSLATSWGSVTTANRAVGQVNLADSTSNEWYLTGCMLEEGSKASDFPFEPFETTLRKCQRYYEIGKINMSGFGETGSTDTHCFQTIQFASQKRVAPSITKSNTSYTSVITSGGAVWTNPTTSDAYDDEQIHSFTAGSKIGTSSGNAILKANYDFSADSEL